MAFQPIMDLHSGRPFAYEALVRGVDGQSADTVLSWVDDAHRYRFDQACRVKAIELASRLGLAALPQCRSAAVPPQHQFLAQRGVPCRNLYSRHHGGGQGIPFSARPHHV